MRSPSLPLSEYDAGSPDPLGSSTSSGRAGLCSSKRTISSAPKKQHTPKSSVESISILPPSSPSRTVTEQTLSPWKIRVTVEAEPEDQMEGLMRTTTRTMKVPLRDEEPSTSRTKPESRRPSSRSRTGSPSKAQRRSVTPVGGRRRRQSVTDLDIVVLGDDAEEDEWAPRSRKSSPAKSSSRRNGRRSRSQEADSANTVGQGLLGMEVNDDEQQSVTEPSPELRQIDLNKVSVRPRTNSTKEKAELGYEPGNEEVSVPASRHKLPAVATRRVSNNSVMSYPTPSPTVSERGNSDDLEKGPEQTREHLEGFDTIMESEGFTMIDLDSIPSVRQILSSPSENETSNLDQLSPITERETSVLSKALSPSTRESPHIVASAIPPHLQQGEDESEISSTVPSSPPTFQARPPPVSQKLPSAHLLPPSMAASQPRNRLVTPHTLSSPKLPSPPRQTIPKDRSTPDSAQALKAGIMLQGAVDPVSGDKTQIARKQDIPKALAHVRSSSEEIFEGFDSGTKRELRAGLRFGEELAKRRQPPPTASRHAITQQIADRSSQMWRGESVVSRTPIQASEDEALGKQNTSYKLNEPSSQRFAKFTTHRSNTTPDMEVRQMREYQLEKQAISNQIETASPDKVIVINSDDESSTKISRQHAQDVSMQDITMNDDDDDDGDIWLEEAKDASSSPHQSEDRSELLTESEQGRQHDRAKETAEQPRRGAIPSPWKRGEQIGDGSSIYTNGEEMSGLFWKQPQGQDNVNFGDAAIKKVRNQVKKSGESAFAIRRNSGAFDIEKMLGTPVRIRESLDREKDQVSSSGSRNDASSETNPEPDEDVFSDEEDEEDSQSPTYSEEVSDKSDGQPDTIVVNFNDSSSVDSEMTPPQGARPRAALFPSAARPPTPRSAMKGSRQSFGAANREPSGDIDQGDRKVVFAERSRGVNIDWVESSSSVLSGSVEASSPTVEHQRHHGERRQAHFLSSPAAFEQEAKEQKVMDEQHEKHEHEHEPPVEEAKQPEQTQAGWFGWLRKGKQPESVVQDKLSSPITPLDGMVELDKASASPVSQNEPADDWAPTSLHAPPSQPATSSQHRTKSASTLNPKPKSASSRRQNPIPSYLLAPSYPSDPSRSPSTPLDTTGDFTTKHFRTLHILHAKSQRPRFHAPEFAECRPEIRDLAQAGWKLKVDESDAGLGGFEWSFGKLEARTLERFCREVEFGYVVRQEGEAEASEDEKVVAARWLDRGIWSGGVAHGGGRVEWGWDVERLATWLGRIVVGEVVRKEEHAG